MRKKFQIISKIVFFILFILPVSIAYLLFYIFEFIDYVVGNYISAGVIFFFLVMFYFHIYIIIFMFRKVGQYSEEYKGEKDGS